MFKPEYEFTRTGVCSYEGVVSFEDSECTAYEVDIEADPENDKHEIMGTDAPEPYHTKILSHFAAWYDVSGFDIDDTHEDARCPDDMYDRNRLEK